MKIYTNRAAILTYVMIVALFFLAPGCSSNSRTEDTVKSGRSIVGDWRAIALTETGKEKNVAELCQALIEDSIHYEFRKDGTFLCSALYGDAALRYRIKKKGGLTLLEVIDEEDGVEQHDISFRKDGTIVMGRMIWQRVR